MSEYAEYSKLLREKERMELRDQFATAALTGLLARNGVYEVIEDVVIDSYRIADAMIKEREITNER